MKLKIEPCIFVEEKTAKEHFAKIDEELNELKAVVLRESTVRNRLDDVLNGVDDDTDTDIVGEAIDTITAIVSMLNALEFTPEQINAACELVIAKNRGRGRLE